MVGHQQRGHPIVTEAEPDPVTGSSGLGDLELGLTDAVPVTDADLVVGQPLDGEVLPEDPPAEVGPVQVSAPVLVGVRLVHHHGTLLAAVPVQIALPVAVEVQPPGRHRPVDRLLPDAGVDHPVAPGDVPRPADVHRQQRGHGSAFP